MQLHTDALDLKLAFDRAGPMLLKEAMTDSAMHPVLAVAMHWERLGGN